MTSPMQVPKLVSARDTTPNFTLIFYSLRARVIPLSGEEHVKMRISPKLALTTTAVLVAVGLLWVGFVEGGGGQSSHRSGTSGQYLNQFVNKHIAPKTMAASAITGFPGTGASPAGLKSQDNVPALALSATLIASLVMVALAIARFQAVHPTVRPIVLHATAATRRDQPHHQRSTPALTLSGPGLDGAGLDPAKVPSGLSPDAAARFLPVR